MQLLSLFVVLVCAPDTQHMMKMPYFIYNGPISTTWWSNTPPYLPCELHQSDTKKQKKCWYFLSKLGIILYYMVYFFSKSTAFIWETYNYKEDTKKNGLAAIHVIKRSIDLQLWIMVSGGCIVLNPIHKNKYQVIKFHMLHNLCDLKSTYSFAKVSRYLYFLMCQQFIMCTAWSLRK